MATRAEIERDRLALKALVSNAQGELSEILKRIPSYEHIATMSDSAVVDIYKIIENAWWQIADKYGSMGAVLGQAQAALLMDGAGFPAPKLGTPVGIPDTSGTAAAVISALSQDDWQAALSTGLDGTIKTANTWSLCDTLNNNGAELIWHPIGDTCRYCLQRASYGPYRNFRSEAQARGFATKPHDHCDCRPDIIPPDGSYPDGYEPDEYARKVAQMDREKASRAKDRLLSGSATPGPKTRESARRDASAKAWADRQRIASERDAAKKKLAGAIKSGDAPSEKAAREVLDRTAREREALNGLSSGRRYSTQQVGFENLTKSQLLHQRHVLEDLKDSEWRTGQLARIDARIAELR